MTDITATHWLKWTPDGDQRITLRTGGSVAHRRQLAIDELLLTLPDDQIAAPTVHLRFRVDLDTFSWMQSERWFNLPVGFTENAGIEFVADRPIEMAVVTAPLERGGYPLNALLARAEDDEAKLAVVLGPFLDPELERPINDPHLYEVVRVSQARNNGEGPGFDRTAIEAWERSL
ncbi:hypothetical protein [Haliangium sp.]|uniref:hypothetical protein n=1 Tax=Haliangium sp. TaxID=2663208 RepID=UPI003D12879B